MKLNRDFKGIWIPKDIWFITSLKPANRVFLAEIDSLDNGEGCFAANAHFSMMFGLSKNRCSEIIMMLEKGGFVAVEHDVKKGDNFVRIIKVMTPFGKSTPPSVSRQTPSVSRQTPSENRQAIYKELEIHIEIQERGERPLDFLFSSYEQRFTEQFLMPYKSKIKNFKKFWDDFNDTVDLEKRTYDTALFPRLSKYARNWIENQDKFSKRDDLKLKDNERQTNPNLGKAI